MTGTEQARAGVGTPMPRHWQCVRLYRVNESMRAAKQNCIRNRLQCVLYGAIQHPATASSTRLHDQSDAVSGCLITTSTMNKIVPNRNKGLGGGNIRVNSRRIPS